MAGEDRIAVGGGANRDARAAVVAVEDLRLVLGVEGGNLHLAVLRAKADALVAGRPQRPRHARNRRVLQKLVANRLLVSPLGAEAVDKNNKVRLSDGELCRVRRKTESAYSIGLSALSVGGARAKLLTALTSLIIEIDEAGGVGDGEALIVGAPRQRLNAGDALLRGGEGANVADLHFCVDSLKCFAFRRDVCVCNSTEGKIKFGEKALRME